MTLTEFLTARLDEDEEATRVGHLDPTYDSSPIPTLMDHGEMYVPGRRWLADVDAKRRIVEQHGAKLTEWSKASGDPYVEQHCTECGAGTPSWGPGDLAEFEPTDWPCTTLRLLALPYADHEAYDETWRPDEEPPRQP